MSRRSRIGGALSPCPGGVGSGELCHLVPAEAVGGAVGGGSVEGSWRQSAGRGVSQSAPVGLSSVPTRPGSVRTRHRPGKVDRRASPQLEMDTGAGELK